MTEKQKELVVLAAKATGYIIERWETGNNCEYSVVQDDVDSWKTWNPLTSDSDCFQMETELEIDIWWVESRLVVADAKNSEFQSSESFGTDKAAARRLASTSVAAEIQRRKESKV